MRLKLNKNKIFKETGIQEMENENYLFYVQEELDYLLYHNKNYTKKQYQILTDIKMIIDNIEIE